MSSANSCPDEAALAAFFDATLSDTRRQAIAAHLAGCEPCRSLIGALNRLADAPLPTVDGALVANAVEGARPSTVGRYWSAAAVAASVVLAVGLWQGRPDSETDDATPRTAIAPDEVSDVRGAGPSQPPLVLEPPAGATLGTDAVAFRWTPVVDAVQYRVQVLTDDGSVVWSASTAGTTIVFKPDTPLPAGQTYYAWVSAQLPEGRRLLSAPVRLTSGGR